MMLYTNLTSDEVTEIQSCKASPEIALKYLIQGKVPQLIELTMFLESVERNFKESNYNSLKEYATIITSDDVEITVMISI